MSMLALRAEPIYGGQISRYDEVRDLLRAPEDLAAVCSRPSVWRRIWHNVTICTQGSQDTRAISDLDWIEYVPDPATPLLTE